MTSVMRRAKGFDSTAPSGDFYTNKMQSQFMESQLRNELSSLSLDEQMSSTQSHGSDFSKPIQSYAQQFQAKRMLSGAKDHPITISAPTVTGNKSAFEPEAESEHQNGNVGLKVDVSSEHNTDVDHGSCNCNETDNLNDDGATATTGPEPVRLFVGQVPESMVEEHLTELFRTVGVEVVDIAIIRDKHTARHRHCAFITVPSREQANLAIDAFHNKKYLESMSNPMQVKEANQPKPKQQFSGFYHPYFGMIPNVNMGMLNSLNVMNLNELQLRQLYMKNLGLSNIPNLSNLSNLNGVGTPVNLNGLSNLSGLNQMNMSNYLGNLNMLNVNPMLNYMNTMNNVNQSPVATQSAKPMVNMGSVSVPGVSNMTPMYQSFPMGMYNYTTTGATTPTCTTQMNQIYPYSYSNQDQTSQTTNQNAPSPKPNQNNNQTQYLSQQQSSPVYSQTQSIQPMQAFGYYGYGMQAPNQAQPEQMQPQSLMANQEVQSFNVHCNHPVSISGQEQSVQNGSTTMMRNPSLIPVSCPGNSSNDDVNTDTTTAYSSLKPCNSSSSDSQLQYQNQYNQQMLSSFGLSFNPMMPLAGVSVESLPSKKSSTYAEGPMGANLFVNNLPDDFTDDDLMNLFMAHGNILSSKVFIDKYTHKSKGFGFVSFSNIMEAAEAIREKNGYEISKDRRIIVETKRSKRNFF